MSVSCVYLNAVIYPSVYVQTEADLGLYLEGGPCLFWGRRDSLQVFMSHPYIHEIYRYNRKCIKFSGSIQAQRN